MRFRNQVRIDIKIINIPEDVIHLHGILGNYYCTNCDSILDSESCWLCTDREDIKPYVRFFGEQCPEYDLLHNAMHRLKKTDVFINVGTSGNVINLDDINDYYKKTRYYLNVLDDDHKNYIPGDETRYHKKSCVDFFKETFPELIEYMEK